MSNVSISSSFNYDIKIEKQIELISNIGFSFFSFGANQEHFNYKNQKERIFIKKILSNNGIIIDTIHGKNLNEENSIEELKRTIEAAQDFDAKVIVMHISPFHFDKKEYKNIFSMLLKKIDDFIKLIEKEKIKIALENVFPYHENELLLNFYNQINSGYVGFCYDSSHDQIDGPRDFSFLEKIKNNLFAVHLSDRIKEFVDHVIPGEGFINFNKMLEILKKSIFKGPYLFEVMMTNSKYKDPKIFLEKVFEKGCKITQKLNSQK